MRFRDILAWIVGSEGCVRLPVPYVNRDCREDAWRDAFGELFDVADRTLCTFCAVFSFPVGERFKFRPCDKIMDIYTALYSSRCGPDSSEPGRFIDALEREFSMEFIDSNDRLRGIETFGQIVREVMSYNRKCDAFAIRPGADKVDNREECAK